MASPEELDITYLCSMDAALPPSPMNITSNHTHSLLNHTHSLPNHTHAYHLDTLGVPRLLVSVEECGGKERGGRGMAGTRTPQPGPRHSGTDMTPAREEGEEEEEVRPTSVLAFLQRPISRARSALSTHSTILANVSTNVKTLLHRLADRTQRSQHHDDSNLDGYLSSSSVSDPEGSLHSVTNKKKLDSLADSTDWSSDVDLIGTKSKCGFWCPTIGSCLKGAKVTCDYYVDPCGNVFFYWMALVCLAYVYNVVAIPLRASFEWYAERGLVAWLLFDYLCDLVYLLDIVVVQCHLSYINNGTLESSMKKLKRRYFYHWAFWLDLVSLAPLEVLYAVPAVRFNALLRLPRLFKLRSVMVFLDRFESNTRFPHIFRVAKLVCYFLYLIHIYTCIYYFVSRKEGFGSNEWVYNGQGISYLRCFYWATLSVATIHDLELTSPTNNTEYTIELLGYLFGVFIIAVIIGEIRSIVEASNSHRLAVHMQWDRLKEYMKLWKIPKELQDRIRSWYNYAISQQLLLDEAKVLESLPKKMKADLAIHVHLDTLSRVALFQEFEKTLLRELVLKLRHVLFVPGDLICTKGEIGKEMYIVNQGRVEVIGGALDKEVLAELGPGSVFGEISLLAVGGGNRRTAHVRSKGFSSLFVLSKKDLHETLEDYPDAQATLKQKARYLLHQDKKRERRNTLQAQTLPPSQVFSGTSTASVPKVAMTTTTTAAHAARARAAVNKLEEERAGSQEGYGEVGSQRGSQERWGEGGSQRDGQQRRSSLQMETHVATIHEGWEGATTASAGVWGAL